ncbi:hypothetical protein Bca4012_017596 [Brassica carinata]
MACLLSSSLSSLFIFLNNLGFSLPCFQLLQSCSLSSWVNGDPPALSQAWFF